MGRAQQAVGYSRNRGYSFRADMEADPDETRDPDADMGCRRGDGCRSGCANLVRQPEHITGIADIWCYQAEEQ